ncbi:MAG: PIN domain nuclease, partial [Pseudomonadota bacterium]
LSPISCWEIMTLARKRRIDIRGVAPDVWITRALNTLPLEQASISNEIAVRSELIQLPHWDPADRFLAATAIESRFVLVTGDLLLLRCPDVETLSNR